jgi:hypothetical protein
LRSDGSPQANRAVIASVGTTGFSTGFPGFGRAGRTLPVDFLQFSPKITEDFSTRAG